MKSSGLGDQLYVDGYELGGDIGSVGNVAGGNAPLGVTGINKSAFERIGGQRDGTIEFSAWFNPASNQAHPVLSTLPTANRAVTYCRGTVLGDPAANLVGKQIGYNGSRGDDGSFTLATTAQANGFGLEWGTQLTPGITQHTGADQGTSVDFGTGSTAFGLQAYVQVTAFVGTSATITVQESSDDGAVDTFTDVVGGAFTAVTAPRTSERIETARNLTVERYLRVATTGTFSTLQFLVVVARNETAVAF